MLTYQTVEKLLEMKLEGMAEALRTQLDSADYRNMSFEDRLGMLVDAEFSTRQSVDLNKRIKQAGFRQAACIEDIDYQNGLDRTTVNLLSQCGWVTEGIPILIDGKTGVGKTFLSTALAHKACRRGFTALCLRAPRLFQELTLNKLSNKYCSFLKKLQKIDVLVLDDFALAPMTDEQSRDLLEVVDDRVGKRPVIISSQIPPEKWYDAIPSATIADAILDRIIHGAYKLHLTGESRRKNRRKQKEQKEATVA
jgi:DNA replication protein DnaC